jgi:hypothetical protein
MFSTHSIPLHELSICTATIRCVPLIHYAASHAPSSCTGGPRKPKNCLMKLNCICCRHWCMPSSGEMSILHITLCAVMLLLVTAWIHRPTTVTTPTSGTLTQRLVPHAPALEHMHRVSMSQQQLLTGTHASTCQVHHLLPFVAVSPQGIMPHAPACHSNRHPPGSVHVCYTTLLQ